MANPCPSVLSVGEKKHPHGKSVSICVYPCAKNIHPWENKNHPCANKLTDWDFLVLP